MKFIKFPSLNNVSSAMSVTRVENAGLTTPNVQWMVTEKIHGANFGIYSDGNEVKFAKRTGFVEQGENFFDSRRVVEDHKPMVQNLAMTIINSLRVAIRRSINKELSGNPYAIVFGELFGGSIQKNMPYQEKQDFCVFDFVIVLDDSNKDIVEEMFETGVISGINHVEDKLILAPSNKLFMFEDMKRNGFLTAPLIKVGTFAECMAVSNDFESVFTDNARVNNLQLSEEFRNLRCKSEGLVIEPVVGLYISQQRVYLKNRSVKFEEKKSEPKKNVTQMQLDTLSPKAIFVLEHIEDRICENRFNSVVSKIGEVGIKDFNMVSGLLLQDALEDFEKDELYDMDTDTVGKTSVYLDKAEYKAVSKIALFSIRNLIRPLLLAK